LRGDGIGGQHGGGDARGDVAVGGQRSVVTGTWLNLNRATYPVQLQTPRVNAGNAALTPSNVRLAINEVVELRQEPKYPGVNRWHIERWVPPEAYGSPRLWYAQTIERDNGVSIPALGPYPSQGEYEPCFTLEDPQGEFVQLTPTVAEHIARAIEVSRRLPRAQRRCAINEREVREDRAYEAWAYDLLDDATPALHKQPFIVAG
jgi:hypothetical protein